MTMVDCLEGVAKAGSATRRARYISHAESIFDDDEWRRLADLVSSPILPYEHVEIGDAGEPNRVSVGRFMTDVDEPRCVNEPLSSELLDLLSSPRRRSFHEQLFGGRDYFIRRAQVNVMESGSFIGRHLDTDSNPDYEYSITLQLGTAFSGGEFRVFEADRVTTTYEPEHRSIIVSPCDLPHEVKAVLSGQRVSLVYFLSEHPGANRRQRTAASHALESN